MSYIGNSPISGAARILEGSGTGDGTTTSFPVGFVPGAEQEVLVFIDGIKQDTTSYDVVGDKCIFTTAPLSGENLDFIGYEVGKSVVPQDFSIDQSKINTASLNPIIQIVRTDDGSFKTGTTTIPFDNTIPQNTEGTEFLAVSITPTSSTNKLVIEVSLNITHSTSDAVAAALFQDSNADAFVVADVYFSVGNDRHQLLLSYEMIAGTTNSTTFKVRAGPSTTGTVRLNGSVAAEFGGVSNSFIKVTEVMQ